MVVEVEYLSPRSLLILATALSSLAGISAENIFLPPLNSSCACPNQNLTFQCTITGDGATIWGGSAFSCAENGNEIILRHSSFAGVISKECNGGAIFGQSSGVQSDQYTSQLFVNVSTDLNGRTVNCTSSIGPAIVGEAVITVNTAPIDQVPTGITLTNVEPGQLIFTWNAVNTNCPSINYLPSSNCNSWSCVNPTNTTTTICSGLQLPSVCTFTVQTEVCGQVGLSSEPIRVRLRVPDIPMVKIIPVYSGAQQGLLRIKANITDGQVSFNITDTVSGSVTSYSISFNSANAVTFGRSTSCVEDICEYLINVPSDLCQSSNDVNVALSASNRLGQGPPSDPTTIGCINRFVEVEYDRMTSSITCRFLDETDTSIKSCSVTYGQCSQVPGQVGQLGNSSTMETPNVVYIKIPVSGDDLKCYNVTASSDVFTVIVQAMGSNTKRATDADIVIAIVVPIVAVFVVLIITIVMLIILIKLKISKKRNTFFALDPGDGGATSNDIVQISMVDLAEESQTVTDLDQLDLQPFPRGVLEVHRVSHDCELREYVENKLKLEFKRGCVFYEFVHDFEDISEDKEVILCEKDHRNFWYEDDSGTQRKNPLIGHKIPRPSHEEYYDIFVQSTGSGARHLPAGSRLLYSKSKDSTRVIPDREPPLKRIISSHFKMKTMASDTPVEEYCKINKCNIFLELGTFEKTSDVIDVILQNKEAEEQLYTGPTARKMVKDHYTRGGTEGFDREKWRVFVLCKFYNKGTVLTTGTNILQYKKRLLIIDNFHVLTAGEDEGCSSLSKFVEQKVEGAEFINGNAFYEFKREEDLQYYKEVLHWDSQTEKLKSNIHLFYDLPGVPAVCVKPPRKKGCRVFIQSTSQGARCVKAGDTILYKNRLVLEITRGQEQFPNLATTPAANAIAGSVSGLPHVTSKFRNAENKSVLARIEWLPVTLSSRSHISHSQT